MFSEQLAIRAEGLGKTYLLYERPLDRLKQLLWPSRRFGRQFVALADVSFELSRGQVLGVIGNNGAGKSTLLQLLCRTLTPTGGRLEVNGRVAALLELGAGFNPEFTGRENIFLNAAVLGLSTEEINARYESIVDFSGIRDFIEQPVKTYSSGMYVRLAFSIATSVAPDILVIDEALSVGDGAFARKSFDRIMALREMGTTILFCSHSMYQVEAICDQVLWLERGCPVMLGKPGDVTSAYRESMARAESGVDVGVAGAFVDKDSSQPLLKGQGRLTRLALDVDGVPVQPCQVKARESTLGVTVDFEIDPQLPRPTVVFSLETQAGVSVSSGGTLFDDVITQVDARGFGSVRLAFPRLPLMRGKYRMTIYLACERGVHVYEQATHALVFEVDQDGLEQGLVFLPHIWALSPGGRHG